MANTIWNANLEAFRARDPSLARRLASIPIDAKRFVIGKAADGSALLGVRMGAGTPSALGHPHKPKADAEAWARGIGDGVLRGGNVILLGFGSGHHPRALFDLSDGQTLLHVVEPDAALLAAALRLGDFRALIASPRVFFHVEEPESETARALFAHDHAHRARAQGVSLACPPYANALYGDYLARLKEAIHLEIQLEGLRFRTWEEHSSAVFRNILANLPDVLRGAPCLRLLNKAAGVPALVVAPGPSLEPLLPLLREAAPRTLIVAVDTAHRILLRNGVEADFVVSLDFTPLNARHFEGIEDARTALLAFPGVDPVIPARYPGRAYYFDHAPSVEKSGDSSNLLHCLPTLRLGRLISGGSTAHAVYHAARLMGCAPIILVGNDLGFPDRVRYAPGALQNELDLPEMKDQYLIEVPANDGGMVAASGLYKVYLDAFGGLIAGTGGWAINASPRGARIQGVPYQPLDETLKRCPNREIDKSFIREALHPPLSGHRASLLGDLRTLIDQSVRARERLARQESELAVMGTRLFHERFHELKEVFQEAGYASGMALTLIPRSYHVLIDQLNRNPRKGGSVQETEDLRRRYLDFLGDMIRSLEMMMEALREVERKI